MAAIVEGMQAGADADEVRAVSTPEADIGATPRRWQLSLNSVLGTLAVALVTTMFGVLMWQVDSLGARIDEQGDRIEGQGARIDSLSARIDSLGTELRAELHAEIGSVRADMADLEAGLRAEMQAGFREINLILLDHTDRLARLEAAAGLPRPSD
ncbi:MAG: hypothetical protein F4117_08230 [Acidimicrobiales bacterium]|nr:hypothetical protein [Acidimicrobiales bacterium]MXZ15898.1 hypothetical protein [Acidimicrobiales bacterium]MYB80075.1 hypothetical protein [Acidimicrobiales bacterium]MYG62829.1 hypothetical protein [Acidimicrobiales bacterium]MYI12538.1 hypothetical protein [Acidimicrobiales bacterium]